jgi:hypothetical protein
VRGAQHLAEVVVAVHPLHRHPRLVRAERPERLAQPGGVVLQPRHDRERGVQPLLHMRGHRDQPGGVEHPGGQRPGQVGVHLGGGVAEPVRLAGEVATDLGRVQVGLGVQVADADLGQLPAVGRGPEVFLQHGQVGPVAGGAVRQVPGGVAE